MTLLILQIAVILLTSLICGWLARKLSQARVIGEIIGGIFIGPSLFGRIAPHAFSRLFPHNSLGSLEILSTLGLILFLFLIGSELDYQHLREQKSTATLASLMSMILPFALAFLAAPILRSRFAPDNIAPLPFMLFLGISMSITAFPVLARILEERAMQSTPLGATAILCAAIDDVSAWLLLGIAITLIPSSGNATPLSHRFLWLAAYLGVMFFVIRPLAKTLSQRRAATAALSYELLGIFLILALASAAATDAIGIHPLFGAFVAGLCFPRIAHWQQTLRAKLDLIVSLVLLPLFFALTGLRTRLDLLNGANVWLWTALILLLAVAGKMGGAIVAARWTGYDWRNAMALGALLNTRGLVELIVLNIAYDAHVFSPTLFTMMVVMALITTIMTVPLLNWLKIGIPKKELAPVAAQ